MKKLVAALLLLVILAGAAWQLGLGSDLRRRSSPSGADEGGASSGASLSGSSPGADGGPGARYPHATKDQAKRDALRARIVAAMADAADAAAHEQAAAAAGQAPAARGNRETNDLKELGKFVSQAIREDFMPMAKECAKEMLARKPDARGQAQVAFTLLGDSKIGGVVDEAKVDRQKSTMPEDARFETCVRESLYGVYFDPPPAGGMATLNFDVTILPDGGFDDDVDDFANIKDRRGE